MFAETAERKWVYLPILTSSIQWKKKEEEKGRKKTKPFTDMSIPFSHCVKPMGKKERKKSSSYLQKGHISEDSFAHSYRREMRLSRS